MGISTQSIYQGRSFNIANLSYVWGSRPLAGVVTVSHAWNAEAEYYFLSGQRLPAGTTDVVLKPEGSIKMLYDDAINLERFRLAQSTMLGSLIDFQAALQIRVDNGSLRHTVTLQRCKFVGFASFDAGEPDGRKPFEVEYKLMFEDGDVDGIPIVNPQSVAAI